MSRRAPETESHPTDAAMTFPEHGVLPGGALTGRTMLGTRESKKYFMQCARSNH